MRVPRILQSRPSGRVASWAEAFRTWLDRDGSRRRRIGSILVLSAAMMVVVFAFVAFTLDLGFIALTKTQLQAAADTASLSAVLDLYEAIGPGASKTEAEAEAQARQTVVDIAALHRAGDLSSVYADPNRDVRVGLYQWDPTSGGFVELWGVQPYNMVEVTLHRDQGPSETNPTGGSNGDGPLPLYFGPVIGHRTANVHAQAVAAMLPGVGFRTIPGANAPVVPLALDELTWNEIMAGIGPDDFTYDPGGGAVASGPDGMVEANLYPQGTTELPPGNRGTVDLGAPNNSTSDIERQILYGLNESDLSYFTNGELRFDGGPFIVQGDTGLSATLKEELASIKGKPVAIPLFIDVQSPGNNATYTISRFVGVRILDVKLTGNPNTMHVTVQPAPVSDSTVIPADDGSVTVTSSTTIFAPPMLIR